MFRRRLVRLLRLMALAPLFLLAGAVGQAGGRVDPRKVAIYIRWSTDDQGGGTTLDVQRDACRHYALSQGWEVPDSRVFIDDGYSGGDLKRPAMETLRGLVKQGEVSCVVVYKIDRLSRNIVDATGLVLREWDGLCHLKCVMEPIDTTTDLGRVIFSILASFADFERSTIRQRTFSGKLRRAREGRNPGIRLPFGYQTGATPGEIVVDETEAAIVRQIYALYAAGTGQAQIASHLNAQGVVSRRGNGWSRATIHDILHNQAYMGRAIYGRTTKNLRRESSGGPARLVREEPLAVADDAYPVIVDRALFERCQQVANVKRTAMQTTSGRGLSSPHLLSGIARCQCGHAFQYMPPRGLNRNAYYRCRGRGSKGSGHCDSGYIDQTVLETWVVSAVKRLSEPDVSDRMLEHRQANLQQQIRDAEARVSSAEQQLRRLREQDDAAFRDYRSGEITAAMLKRIQADVASDRALAEAGLRSQQERVSSLRESGADLQEIRGLLSQVTRWDMLDIQQRKQLLRELIQELVVYKPKGSNELRISLRYRISEILDESTQ